MPNYMVSVTRGDMKYQEEVAHSISNAERYAELMELFR